MLPSRIAHKRAPAAGGGGIAAPELDVVELVHGEAVGAGIVPLQAAQGWQTPGQGVRQGPSCYRLQAVHWLWQRIPCRVSPAPLLGCQACAQPAWRPDLEVRKADQLHLVVVAIGGAAVGWLFSHSHGCPASQLVTECAAGNSQIGGSLPGWRRLADGLHARRRRERGSRGHPQF